jgi:hypothetical protein
MSNSCDSCTDAAREQNREMENLRAELKQKAIEDGKAKAICRDEVTGLFSCDIQTAIAEHFYIIEVISGL